MAQCGNCRSKLNCSCKVRKATDGRSCCVKCVNNYNTLLRNDAKKAANGGVIISAKATDRK